MKVYLVRWKHRYFGLPGDRLRRTEDVGGQLLRAFTRLERAEDFLNECEQARTVPILPANPFDRDQAEAEFRQLANLAAFTTLPEEVLHDWVLDAGLPAPPLPGEEVERESVRRKERGDLRRVLWQRWWDDAVPNASEEQLAAIFRALDRVRFFEIVTTQMRWQ